MNADTLNRSIALPNWLHDGLIRRFGLTRGSLLASRVSTVYADLLREPSPFVDERERAFAAAEILPLLALYRALLADGATAESAESDVRCLRAQALREQHVRGVWLASHVPGRRHWLRRLVLDEVQSVFPMPTFSTETTEGDGDSITFEVKRCPYGAALAAYGAPELLATFCRLDEIRFERLAQGVTAAPTTGNRADGPCRFCFHLHPDTAALENALETVV